MTWSRSGALSYHLGQGDGLGIGGVAIRYDLS